MLRELEINELNKFESKAEFMNFVNKVINETGGLNDDGSAPKIYDDSYYIYDDENKKLYKANEYLVNITSNFSVV